MPHALDARAMAIPRPRAICGGSFEPGGHVRYTSPRVPKAGAGRGATGGNRVHRCMTRQRLSKMPTPGFALLFAQRRQQPKSVYHWYDPADARAARAKRLISQMVRHRTAHQIAPCAVFSTGLSAGGAMPRHAALTQNCLPGRDPRRLPFAAQHLAGRSRDARPRRRRAGACRPRKGPDHNGLGGQRSRCGTVQRHNSRFANAVAIAIMARLHGLVTPSVVKTMTVNRGGWRDAADSLHPPQNMTFTDGHGHNRSNTRGSEAVRTAGSHARGEHCSTR